MTVQRTKQLPPFAGTAIAAVVVIGLGLYAYFGEYEGGKKKDEKKEKDAQIFHIEAAHLKRIEIVNSDHDIVLEKVGDAWQVTAPIKDAADATAVDTLVAAFGRDKTLETVAEGAEFSAAKYGLDKPTGSIALTSDDAKTEKIKIGSKSFDADLYAQMDGENKALLVSSIWDTYIAKTVKDLREKRLFRTGHTDEMTEIRIKSSGKKLSAKGGELNLKKTDGKWDFVEARDRLLPISQAAVQEYLTKVGDLRAQEFVSEDKSDEKVLRKLKLQPPEMSIEIKSPNKNWILVAGKENPDKKEPVGSMDTATSSDMPAIVQVNKINLEGLFKPAADFFDKAQLISFNEKDVTGIEVHMETLKFTAKKEKDGWKSSDKIKAEKLDEFLKALKNLKPKALLGSEGAKGLDSGKNRFRLLGPNNEELFSLQWGDPTKSQELPVRTQMPGKKNLPVFVIGSKDIDTLKLSEIVKP